MRPSLLRRSDAAALPPCPLCLETGPGLYFQEEKNSRREYFSCRSCGLVFVPTKHHLSLEAEKQRYDLHRNDPSDTGYREYLNRLAVPLLARLEPGSRGLDFGSGPSPVLAAILRAAGHPMEVYDPFYAPDASVLGHTYDFVTTTEAVEHFRDPAETLDRLWALVRPGGRLGILTQFLPSSADFDRWSYKNDPTHLAFFSRETFEWLAARWSAEAEFPAENVVLLTKRL